MRSQRLKVKKVREILKPTTNLFNYINYDLTGTTLTNDILSFLFYTKCSRKWCSPTLESLIEYNEETQTEYISEESLMFLGMYIKGILKENWDRLKKVYQVEYDPIKNFSNTTVETISDVSSKTRTDDLVRTDNFLKDAVITEDFNGTESATGETNGDTTEGVFGFNSSIAVDSTKGTDTQEISNSTTREGTITTEDTTTNIGTVKNTGTQKDAGTYDRERTTEQVGNIGNISTQKLIAEEVELWQWKLAEQIVTDVMHLLTLSIY